jgi:hypothetical protein
MRQAATIGSRTEAMTMMVAALGGAVLMTVLSVASLPLTLARRLFLDHFP